MRLGVRAAVLLLALLTLVGWGHGNTIRRSSSFVAPTKGSAHSLMLTTYVTDAADLHYAAVRSGHAPLDAAAIKLAAQPTTTVPENDAVKDTSASPEQHVVQASTVAVHRAQKLECLLDGLEANTSYDVYFVAEVPNSNGVYGPVFSVMGTVTHPVCPDVVSTVAAATNASATSVTVELTLASPGIVHLALVPSTRDDRDSLTAEDVVARNDHDMGAIFTTEKRFRWDLLSTQTIVEGLASVTEYDLLFVTEAPGHGAVFSKLIRQERAVQTHASAPDVVDVTCLPTKASSSSVDIHFRLQFSPEEVGRATPSVLQRFQYDVTYDVFESAANGTQVASRHGSFAVEAFESVENLVRDAANFLLHRSIDGLNPDTHHNISLRVETRNSHGVVSKVQRIENCQTHAKAPKILEADVQSANGTVHALRVDVELKRPGNAHYVLASRSASMQFRNSLQHARSVEEIVQVLEGNAQQYRTGVAETTEANANGSTAVKTFLIDELHDNTPYSIVVIPETIGSFGVYGEPFEKLLEATTNENASEITVTAVQPTFGSVSSIDVLVSMTKPVDILFACWARDDEDEENCREVPRDELERMSQSSQASDFLYRIGNVTEDTRYEVSLFAESHLRNGVRSERTSKMAVETLRQAPTIDAMEAHAVDARVDAIRLRIEISEPGLVHYVIVEDQFKEGNGYNVSASEAEPLSVEAIIDDAARENNAMNQAQQHARHHISGRSNSDPHRKSHAHLSQADSSPRLTSRSAVKRGQALVTSGGVIMIIDGLQSNISYSIHAVTETSLKIGDGAAVSSGVYGTPMRVNTTTHDVAPVIVRAVADATSSRTDSVVVTVNVSRPGIIHYQLTDTDFADPITIKGKSSGMMEDPHVLRGSFVIEAKDMGMEIKNGTNDTQPMEPLVFANNFTIEALRAATTYHLSLTTETLESNGVFGGFPAPILVATHDLPPQFEPTSFFVGPVAGSSTDLVIQFRLDKLGEVHYAIFFRGIVRDRTTDAFEEQEQRRIEEQEIAAEAHARMNENKNSTEKSTEFVKIPRWPPPASVYDLSQLTPRAVKDASLEELGEGVWENGTISVSRDDVFKMKVIEKKVQKLPPNAIFDVCLAPETSASDGIFAPLTCHRVSTHADYSNQSMTFDEVHVHPVAGTKDAVRVELAISKLMEDVEEDSGGGGDTEASIRRLERAAGRVPYLILIDGHEGRPELSHNPVAPHAHHHRHDRTVSPFKMAVPGRGNVVAAGVLGSIAFENDSFVVVERTVTGLKDNHRYYFFFAYETAHSSGVFTKVNPHKHRPNETNTRNPEVQAIEVTTFEQAPRIKRYEAMATYGNTSSITVTIDVACASREEVILHLLVVNDGCPALSPQILLPSSSDLVTVETERLEGSHQCEHPLLYRRVEVNMTERSSSGHHHHHHHHRHHRANEPKGSSIEEVIVGDGVLLPNMTYRVLIATETYNSSGVVSERFEIARVTTLPLAPRFKQLQVQPRKGSTTELLMVVELEYPGEVHYMLGSSGNAELNVTSPYNISAKALPGQRDAKFHDYGRDVVRQRRSVQMEHGHQTHVEVIEYLVAGTSYDVYVVVETADNSGVYGEVASFLSVSTFATPPMLLAHTAYPTPGRTDSLSVGFRAEEGMPCLVHISVITTAPRTLTSGVASGSDAFGNRLAMDDRFVGRTSLAIDGKGTSGDDGWREINVSVPFPGTNYTVFLVTETPDSDGVFGTVATHHGVRSHREPPVPLNVSVRPTDARVDALTVDIGLNHDEGAHIHFAALRHRQRFTRSAITAVGHVNLVGSNATSFIVDRLQGRTTYDVYLRLETFESGGVIGEWTSFPVTATTHGLPAEVLESVECETSPTCAAMGRHPCTHIANVCGECLDGFDGVAGSSNTACNPLEPGSMGPTIKISGVRINPRRRRQRQGEQHGQAIPAELNSTVSDAEFDSAMETTTEATLEAELVVNDSVDAATSQSERESPYRGDSFATSCVASYENPLLTQSLATNYASRVL